MAPRKVNLVAGLIRRKSANQALEILKVLPKKSAGFLTKALASAISNAEHNEKKDGDNLIVESVVVNQGTTMKRGRPGFKGRTMPIKKHSTHVTIQLKEVTKEKPTTKTPSKKASKEIAETPAEAPQK